MTYGLGDGADIRPTAFTADTRGVRGEGVTPYGKFRFESNLLGRHNIYNLLAALGGALGMGIDLETAVSGINRRIVVPGRLEPVEGTGDVSVLVDYAHTDDALTNVLSTLAPLAKGRLITVFGCGGDRDRKKRPKMAAAAAAGSHKVIVTSDNPRTEDPAAIIEEILVGFEGTDYSRVEPGGSFWQDSRKVYTVIPDRREAIRFAVSRAKGGDIVLLAGKGHEDYQIIGTTKYPFDDRLEAKEALDGEEAAWLIRPAYAFRSRTCAPRWALRPRARPATCVFTGVSTDSRTAAGGISSSRCPAITFDGHDFIPAALANGVSGIVARKALNGGPPAGVMPCLR